LSPELIPMSDYSLDPALQAYVAESGRFSPGNDSLAARRRAFAEACLYFTPVKPEGLSVEDQRLKGLAVRLYRPTESAPANGWPTVLYLHGGGWNMGSHRTHDWFVYALAKRLSVAIIAVDYRLAPEHPFPAPLEDALSVWSALRAGYWPDLDADRLAVAGDSAGGTLAAGLCVALRDEGRLQPLLQALAYPVLSANSTFESMTVHAHAPMLTTAGLMGSLAGYVPRPDDQRNPQALALELSDYRDLAPAFVGVAQFDPLVDQGRTYVRALQAAGVSATLHVGQGLVHASLRASGVAQVEAFYDAMANALRDALR
jgi:acetyl esterase